MGKRIHTRIFFPVLIIILFLSLLAWMVFSVTSESYIENAAERSVEKLTQRIEVLSEGIYKNAPKREEMTKEEEREYAKELLQSVKSEVKTGAGSGEVLVFNSKYKQVYPGTSDDLYGFSGLARQLAAMLEKDALKSGESIKIEADGEEWYVRLFKLEAVNNVRAQYYVAAAQIPDMSLLWIYTGNLLAVIAAVIIAAAAVLIWLAAGSISRPLEQLCRQAKEVGEGNYVHMEEVYSLEELETLKEAFNQMEMRIKEKEEQKQRFFQNVSHDLRTPLASITGYAQGIQCGVMKDPQKAAGIILSESLRMTNLVESILTLTKMDNHELELHKVPVDLEEFAEERLEALRGIAEKCRLLLEPCADEICIRTDPELLGRIFQNVISNCIRYARQEVCVCLTREEGWAVILVEDDGPGFDEKDIHHVFERFYKGEKGKFGIGLSVVQTGMAYLGGKAEISNRPVPQQGAVYRLYLPGGM